MRKRPNIMIVDDDQDMLKVLGRTLELEGFSIAVAAEEHRENKTPVTDIMEKSDR